MSKPMVRRIKSVGLAAPRADLVRQADASERMIVSLVRVPAAGAREAFERAV